MPYQLTVQRNLNFINARDYGATGNGTTDDTTAIAAVRSAANAAGGGIVFYPPGTYITGNQTLYTNVIDLGAGSSATFLKLKNGANTDLFSANTGSINLGATLGTSSTGGVFRWGIRDMTLDGNKANQTSGPSWCVRVYGYAYILQNVIMRNGFSGGMLSDWNGGGVAPAPNADVSANFISCEWHDNAGIGLQLGGPHDTSLSLCNSYNNDSHGMHFAPNGGSIKVTECHNWGPKLGVGAVSWLMECQFQATNCNAEGSDTYQVIWLANNSSWVGGNIFGAPAAFVSGIKLGQTAGGTVVPGQLYQSAGVTTSIFATYNTIHTNFANVETCALNFVQESNNHIIANCRQTAGACTIGTPSYTDNYWIMVGGITPDGTLAKSGGIQFSNSAFAGLTFSNESGVQAMKMDAQDAVFLVGNSGYIAGYSDAFFSTQQFKLNCANGNFSTNGNLSLGQSATAVATATAGTIATANIGESRVAPTANITGVILASGTVAGQQVTVVNESAFTITLAASGTSNVAGGALIMIPSLTSCDFNWDSVTALWYSDTALALPVQSATAVATATSGTIATASTDISRVSPAGAVTGVILASGTFAGQKVWVINEAIAANSVTFAASGTSHVAAGVGVVIAGLASRQFVWDSATSLWY